MSHVDASQVSQDIVPQDKITLNSTEALRLEQLWRIQRIRDACADSSLFVDQIYRGRKSLKYLYSPKYNFSYCKVPKVGCSFWTQAFTVLRKGADVAEDVFGMPRNLVHKRLSSSNHVPFDSNDRRQSRSVLISRDPYSRLYSAFVDKIFLPADPTRAGKIVRRQRDVTDNVVCGTDITFQEFLNEILKTAYEKKSLNRHWAPIISLCDPCNVNIFALVKQESFSSDVEFALKEIEIATDEFEAIHDALHDHRIESTVPGIVYTVLKPTSGKKSCKTKTDVAKGIWISFQIQGYLRDNIPFPADIIDSDKQIDPKFLTDLILKTIKDNLLTTEESKKQRHRFLVNAYNNIDKKTIEGIQEIYKQDFAMFNYSIEPPSEREFP